LGQALQERRVNRAVAALALIVVLALAGLAGYWFYLNFSLVEEEVDSGFPTAARQNPLLAAERFLAANSRHAKSQPSLGELPPTHATLIMPGERFDVGPERAARLLDWVRAGGHLVVSAETVWSDEARRRQDWLLMPLGIDSDYTDAVTENARLPLDVDLSDADDFMQVHLSRNQMLTAGEKNRPYATLGSEYGDHILRYRLGKGVLTVLSDADFLENRLIGENDNAALLWHLVSVRPQGEIWLVYSGDMPPLWKWIWQNAWMVVLSFAVLLTAWLIARGRRFGPPLPSPTLQRRRLLDHIHASGLFFWRTGHHEKLLHGARDTLHRDLLLQHPGLAVCTKTEQATRLAALSGYSEDDVFRAMFHPCAADEFEFTRTIQLLAKLRKKL
jgi:hypothetical protein